MKKMIITPLLVAALSFSIVGKNFPSSATSPAMLENIITQEISDKIPDEATDLVQQKLNSIIEVSRDLSHDLHINVSDLDKVSIGTPYIVYDVTDTEQDEIYHYPIINEQDGNIVLLVNVMGTTDGWHYDISTKNIYMLNALNYADTDYIFYGSEGNIIAENEKEKKQFSGNNNTRIKNFECSQFDEKIDAISDRLDELKKTDLNLLVSHNFEVKYAPQVVDVEIGTGKKCELYYRQTQGNYGLCWAASIATIANYLNGTNYTAMQIADKEGIGYNKGITGPNQALKAMLDFGVPYDTVGAALLWDEVKSKIVSKIPIYMAANSSHSGHATVLYGYKNKNGTRYIVMWNPGGGETQVVEYADVLTAYSYANRIFRWTESIYR